jgi:preprotein translocase subunit YajC
MYSIALMQAAQGGGWSMILMLVAMFAIMYFFMIRPQQKKQKEMQNFRNSLTVGQEVVTIGGIYGIVRELDLQNNKVIIEVANGVKIKVHKDGINPMTEQVGGSK